MAWGQQRLSLILAAALLLVVLLNGASAGWRSDLPDADYSPGGWSPIKNVSDPHVQGLGEFAVKAYNEEERENLKFKAVVSVYYQVVDGTNYQLAIKVVDGDVVRTMTYEAFVYEKRSLASFKPLVQG